MQPPPQPPSGKYKRSISNTLLIYEIKQHHAIFILSSQSYSYEVLDLLETIYFI